MNFRQIYARKRYSLALIVRNKLFTDYILAGVEKRVFFYSIAKILQKFALTYRKKPLSRSCGKKPGHYVQPSDF